ncbi:tetratricopeptide repeat-containing glycosyltransferase family 2 protein, partial [Paenibacillus kobensis]|uniref:tetratricopeptide repeat-containing glycosyltransferase family 2 protein n=1 Tax=Paenibacillus kobensis TaxID=59841 RepID=UPI0013E36BA0
MERDRRPCVSLCMIVRDEEAFIEDCIRSAMPYVSEIIVCDTGSQDRTPEIAEGLGAQVVRTEWNDHFAEARNLSIARASQPWILVLDADERLEPVKEAKWSGLLAAEEHAGYCVRLVSQLARAGEDGDETSVTDAVCRLFRNDPRIRFEGIIHEECATAVAAVQGFAPAIVPVTVRHEGYRANVIEQRRKPERNMRLLTKALEKEPAHAVLRYAAGTEMLGAGRWLDAVHWLMPLTEQLDDQYGFESDIRLKLSHALRMAGCLDEAAEQALAGIRRYPDFADLYDALAEVRMEQDDAAAALATYEQSIAAGEAAPYYSSVEGAGSYRSMCGAGAACERLYRWREAAAYYAQALQARPGLERAWTRLGLLMQGDSSIEPVVTEALERLVEASVTSVKDEAALRRRQQWAAELLLQLGCDSAGRLHHALSRLAAAAGMPLEEAEDQRNRKVDDWLAAARGDGAPLPSALAFAALLRKARAAAPAARQLRLVAGKPFERELAEA